MRSMGEDGKGGGSDWARLCEVNREWGGGESRYIQGTVYACVCNVCM